jgi:hypothetical protein
MPGSREPCDKDAVPRSLRRISLFATVEWPFAHPVSLCLASQNNGEHLLWKKPLSNVMLHCGEHKVRSKVEMHKFGALYSDAKITDKRSRPPNTAHS